MYSNNSLRAKKFNIAELCNGSTTDSDSVCEGSNPSSAAKKILTHMSEDFMYYSSFFASFSARFSEGRKCDDFMHLFIILL